MTANDATKNLKIWINIFLLKTFSRLLRPFIGYIKEYSTHEGVNPHVASVQVYFFTSKLSTVRTQTLLFLQCFSSNNCF